MLEMYSVIKAIQKITFEPNRAFSVRELALASALSPASSKSALDYMKEKGIVSLKVIGKTYQYKANLESALCRQWKILFNLDLLKNSGVVEGLSTEIKDIHSILLYGSFALGTNDEKSDIDLLVVTQKKEKPALGFIKNLGKECNIMVLPFNEWKKKAGENKVFYENVIYDSIVLYGKRPVVF